MMDLKLSSLLITILLISISFFTCAQASESSNDGWYISGKIGRASFPNYSHDTNHSVPRWEFASGNHYAVAIGHSMQMASIELEYSYRKFDAERLNCPGCSVVNQTVSITGGQTQHSLIFMGYWTPLQEKPFSPFIGVGAGYTQISWNNIAGNILSPNPGINSSSTVFTYKATAGIEFFINKKTSVLLAHSYLSPDDIEVKSSTTNYGTLVNQEMNIIDLGVKYKF